MTVDDLYLQNLEEYILDEGRIVTYKWLSKTLEVHVNQAKQMLYSFVQQERNKENDQLNVTYFVSGVNECNGVKTLQNQIVTEERLEAAKSRLHPLTSCHVYSVHKTKVKDPSALYMADLDIVKEHLLKSDKFNAIKCTSAKLRSTEELGKLKSVAQPTTTAPSFAKPTSQPSSNNKSTAKKPNSGIAGMFGGGKKKEEKPASTSPVKTNGEHKPAEDKTLTQKASKAKPGGIGHFFGNQAAKPKKESTSSKNNEKQSPIEKKETKESEKSPSPQKPQKEKSPSPNPKSQKSRRKKRADSDEEGEQQKKRRRIKAAAWSDSSEGEEEMETEPQPPTPPPSPPKEPSPSPQKQPPSPAKREDPSPAKQDLSVESEQNSSANRSTGSSTTKRRKRQKKLVSKTFMDEGGFMVTEKVYESCSESASDDEPIPPTPPVKANKQTTGKSNQDKKSPTKKSPGKSGAGNKQSTLMSFFKKK